MLSLHRVVITVNGIIPKYFSISSSVLIVSSVINKNVNTANTKTIPPSAPSIVFFLRLGELLNLGVIALSAIFGAVVPINLGISVTAFSANAFAIILASFGLALTAAIFKIRVSSTVEILIIPLSCSYVYPKSFSLLTASTIGRTCNNSA